MNHGRDRFAPAIASPHVAEIGFPKQISVKRIGEDAARSEGNVQPISIGRWRTARISVCRVVAFMGNLFGGNTAPKNPASLPSNACDRELVIDVWWRRSGTVV